MRARLLFTTLSALILAVVLSSCSVTEDRSTPLQQPEQNGIAEWTVLFYGAGNTDTDTGDDGRSQVLSMVQQMNDIYPVDEVNVLACISSGRTDGRALVYDLSAREESPAQNTSHFIDWGTLDMSSPQTLRSFIEYGATNYPATKYALLIMGEGNAWHGVLVDDVHGSGLPMSLSDFRQAVQATSVHLDLLGWLMPGVSTVEVAYECRMIADHMVACAWPLRHDLSRSPSVWLLDLTANPLMNGERLGMMMVDGFYEAAQQEGDSVHYALLQLQNLSSLVPEIDSLATALAPYTEDETLELPALWTAVWVAQTDDSQSVDVGRLSEQVLAEPALAQDPSVLEAAQHVIESLYDLVVYHRTTVGGESRHGVSIFLPFHPDTTLIAEYAELSLSVDHPGWASLLRATAESAPTLTTLSGNALWAGHAIESIYSFLNTNQFGSPIVFLTQAANIVEVITQDNVRYAASIVLPADSVPCYIGLFEDLDHSASLTAGDRYGYYGVSPQPRTWMTLHPGDHLENVNIQLNLTF